MLRDILMNCSFHH